MEGYIGEIRMFGGNFAPRTWAFCDGRTINIASNTALFSIVGTLYGGNGTTTFCLPDLRSRTAVGAGTGPGLSPYVLGQKGGVETTAMSLVQMPIHTHMIGGTIVTNPVTFAATNGDASTTEPSSTNFPSISGGAAIYESVPTPGAYMGPINTTITATGVSVGQVGSGLPFSIQPPLTVTNYIICMFGIFPSRD
ncbi:MAG: phage tail protein [Bacteroidetes bacterium]|nr:MAG: phage tail protein [Bacteroidota bacterium]